MKEIPPKPYHRHIPHDASDKSAILKQRGGDNAQKDKEISFFEKQIVSIHHLMISKGYLPSLDAIRRAAEEVDGMFDAQTFSGDIPQFLKTRKPEYGERRVLAVEEVFFEMGFLTREALQQSLDKREDDNPPSPNQTLQKESQDTLYSPYIDESTYPAPCYNVGDAVQVSAHTHPGHVRVPSYLLGKPGKVINFQGMFRNPEEVAHFKPTVFRLPLYLVEFELKNVWGEACPIRCMRDKMRAEIYEPWLSQMA